MKQRLAWLVIASFGIPLLLAEGYLQWKDWPRVYDTCGWKYQGTKTNEVNELGYRGQSIRYADTDSVILLIGDSQVEADGVAFDSMPEQLLQQQLGAGYKVFTIGASGYGNDQQWLALQEYFRHYRADKVVVWQTFDNDLWNNTFPTHIPRNGMPKPTFRWENSQLTGPYCLADASPWNAVKLLALLRSIGRKGPDEQWEDYLPRAYQPMYLYTGKADTRLDPAHGGNVGENYTNEKNHYAVRFFPTSPRMDYSVQLTNALLTAMDSECAQHDAKMYVFDVDLKDFNPTYNADTTVYVIGKDFYYSSLRQRRKTMQKVNDGLHAFTVGVYHDHWSLSALDPHLNARTNDEVMQAVADSIR